MYLWAESQGYVNGLIGEHDPRNKIHPPLTVSTTIDQRGTCKLKSPLLKKTVSKPVLPTPTHREITVIHQALAEIYDHNIDLMVRDALILTWAESTGARRMEVISLTVAQIPDWDKIELLEDTQEKQEITVTGKGNKIRSLWVGADLLIQSREYIENERAAVIARFQARRGSVYKSPKEIFLSSKTGRQLHEDTVSQRFAIAFRKAQVKGWLHRVRARFLTELMITTLEAELEKLGSIPDATSVLLPVAEIAGHSNVESLTPYLAAGKKRLLHQTLAERTASLNERALSSERRAAVNLAKLRSSKTNLDLVKALSRGRKKEIVRALSEVCKSFNIDGQQIVSEN